MKLNPDLLRPLLGTIGLMIGLVGAVALGWYFAVRSLPDYDAQLALAGLELIAFSEQG